MGLLIFLDVLLTIMLFCAMFAIVDALATRSKVGTVLTFLVALAIVVMIVIINVSFLDFIHSGGFLV